MSSIHRGRHLQAYEAQRLKEWHIHFIMNKSGMSAFRRVDSEFLTPIITLAPSAAKPTIFSRYGMFASVNTALTWLYKLAAVALTTGTSAKKDILYFLMCGDPNNKC